MFCNYTDIPTFSPPSPVSLAYNMDVCYLFKCDVSFSQIEEEANGDLFDIEINVSDPEKVGKFLEPRNSDSRLSYSLKTILRFQHDFLFSFPLAFFTISMEIYLMYILD